MVCRSAERFGWRSEPMTLVTVRKSLTAVFVMFLVISFWQNPSASANGFSDFVGDVGGFFSSIIDKTAEFLRALF